MDTGNLKERITIDDIPPPYNKFAAVVGIDILYELCELLGGKRLSIPTPDMMASKLRRRLLVEDYSRGNTTLQQVADRYEVSLQTAFNYTRK